MYGWLGGIWWWAASTFSSAAAIFVAAWLLRQLIINRLVRSVAHEFDARLEALRAELNRQGTRESAVLATALGAVTAAQTSAQDARLTALRDLWDAVLEIRTSVTFSGSLDILTAEELQRAPAEHKKILDRTIDLNRAYLDDPLTLFERFQRIERVRPLVSDVAWAYFFAYRAFEFRILHLISHYRETREFISPFADRGLKQIIESVLTSDDMNTADQQPIGRLTFIRGMIEQKLLDELRDGIAGKRAGADSLTHAQSIISAIQALERQSPEEHMSK